MKLFVTDLVLILNNLADEIEQDLTPFINDCDSEPLTLNLGV